MCLAQNQDAGRCNKTEAVTYRVYIRGREKNKHMKIVHELGYIIAAYPERMEGYTMQQL